MQNKSKVLDKVEYKNFGRADEVREFSKGRLELVTIGGRTVGRITLQPGWRWSESVQPIVNTKSCEVPHFQYQVSGVLKVRTDDGAEFELLPGDLVNLPAGHDAWVVGSEPVVAVDFQGMLDYARNR